MPDVHVTSTWAARICEAWRVSLEGILTCGQLLTDAKDVLPHGEFERMVGTELPFKPSTARRLMIIAADERLTNRAHVHDLPPHWGTLYELTKLDDVTLARAFAEGSVRPDMERSDAVALRVMAGGASQPPLNDTCTVADLEALMRRGEHFGAILSDPPWSFRVYSGKGKTRSAERQYDTMTLDEIKALPVANLAAQDCALFLWSVMPQLSEALAVIDAWGFTYKTCGFCWVKQNESGRGFSTGMGYWTRANAELCLLATRGAPKRLHKDVQQLLVHPLMEHSRKPGIVHERIERLVGGPYLEMFGRRITRGWTVWGNEIERRLFDGDAKAVA